jgi:4-diphosphocytidyl-2-C-methyl-D-erythritol kinase
VSAGRNATMPVRELARAKINLTLAVLGRRPDGYHAIESLVTFADVHDTVMLDPAADAGVSVTGPFARSIAGENLLVRALARLRDSDARLGLGSVHLDKQLPVAAGLGGGSADAAALLRAVRRANTERAAGVPWLEIAAQLGADVPVCLDSRPALMWGAGDKIAPVKHLAQAHAVLVNPGLPLPTADVFRALEAGLAPAARQPPTPELPRLQNLIDYMRMRGNDLERPATRLLAVIREVREALEAQPECLLAAMTGSGPTCFGLFAGEEQANRAAAQIAAAQPGWWVQPALLQGSAGPG